MVNVGMADMEMNMTSWLASLHLYRPLCPLGRIATFQRAKQATL
jgi:hypothetical protein